MLHSIGYAGDRSCQRRRLSALSGRTIAAPVNAPADKIGDRLHVSDLLDNINPAVNPGGIGLRNSYGQSRLAHYDEAGNVLVTDCDERHQGREYGRPVGEEALRLGRPRTKEAVEPGEVRQQPDSRISLAAR